MHLYPLYGTELSKISTNNHINDNRLSYIMSSSNIRTPFIVRGNARTRDDNPSMLHRPRTAYITFGQFQRISVDSSNTSLRVSVVHPMRWAPYRKALVNQHFFRKIKHLATNNTFSHGDLMSTVASYFDFETGTTETKS